MLEDCELNANIETKFFVCESLSKLKSISEKRFLRNVELIYILKAFLLPIFTQTFVSKRVLSFG